LLIWVRSWQLCFAVGGAGEETLAVVACGIIHTSGGKLLLLLLLLLLRRYFACLVAKQRASEREAKGSSFVSLG
jgi:hypothetical protein